MIKENRKPVEAFLALLEKSVSRYIERISILPLHGNEFSINSIGEAIEEIQKYIESASSGKAFERYEIQINYNTGDLISASFKEKKDAIRFLETFTY